MPSIPPLLVSLCLAAPATPPVEPAPSGAAPAAHLIEATPLAFRADPIALATRSAATTQDLEDVGAITVAPVYGDESSRRWRIHGAIGSEFGDPGDRLYLGGVGFTHFLARGLSLDLELNGVVYSQESTDAGINANVLFRWHFLMEPSWSLFVDAGAGFQITTGPVPENGSEFNFTPQAGTGFTLDIGNDNRLIAGVRWQHVSNAQVFSQNPGRDSLLVWVGVEFPF